jgi:hypothetical protein
VHVDVMSSDIIIIHRLLWCMDFFVYKIGLPLPTRGFTYNTARFTSKKISVEILLDLFPLLEACSTIALKKIGWNGVYHSILSFMEHTQGSILGAHSHSTLKERPISDQKQKEFHPRNEWSKKRLSYLSL